MKDMLNAVHALKPVLLMVVVQIANALVNVFYKLAINDGMSMRVVIAYRFVIATAFIAPIALIVERKKRTKMTWTILFQAFLSGLFGGAFAQNFNLEALVLTSVTFASAITNLVPAFTFIIAVSFGLERLNLRTAAGKAKIIGTLIGIGGAMILTFFKGVEIELGSFHINLLQKGGSHVAHPHPSSRSRTILGAVCAVASNSSYALWLIIQAKMNQRYPFHYSSTALMSLMASLICIAFALCFERDWNQWRLGWNIRLLTVAYAGIVVSGVMVAVISWCVHMRGPLFVSVFNPLNLVVATLAGYVVLDEKLHLGSIIGAVFIVCGLYVVLWGKGKEMKKMNQFVQSKSSQSNTVEIMVSSPVEDKNKDNNNNTHDTAENVIRVNEGSTGNERKE